jgi:hypothetical protein
LLRTWIRRSKKFGTVVNWSNREVDWTVRLNAQLSSLSSRFLYRKLSHFLLQFSHTDGMLWQSFDVDTYICCMLS